MATKLKRTEQVNDSAPILSQSTNDETLVTVDADALIRSILNNTNTNDNHSKEYIMCRSITNGSLNINCQSGNIYEFSKYGSDCEIEYHDLATLVRKHSDHIFNPRIVIEDDSFVSEFPQLKKVYEKIYTNEDIEKILNLSIPQMTSEINAMPKGVFESTRSLVATKIADGSIDSVRRIRELSKVFDSDFNLLSELFSN